MTENRRGLSRDPGLSGVFMPGRFHGIVPGDTVGFEFSAGPGAAICRFTALVASVTDDSRELKFLILDMDT